MLDEPGVVTVAVTGKYEGTPHEDKPFCGDTIDMHVTVQLSRIAGRTGFASPEISATGSVNDDWVDPELRFGKGAHAAGPST